MAYELDVATGQSHLVCQLEPSHMELGLEAQHFIPQEDREWRIYQRSQSSAISHPVCGKPGGSLCPPNQAPHGPLLSAWQSGNLTVRW